MCTVIQEPDGGGVELPLFEATPSKPRSPLKVTFGKTGLDGDGNDSDSSDWSSSSDGEGGGDDMGVKGGGGEGGGEMKPSHHTNLIAEWEWRTMADSSDPRLVR